MSPLVLAALVMLAVGGLAYVFIYPLLSGEAKAEKRQAAVAGSKKAAASDRNVDAAQRRKQVADSLKELDKKGKSKKASLDMRLQQAGLGWTKRKYMMFCAACAVGAGVVVLLMSGNVLLVPPAMAVGGFGVPAWVISFLRKRRVKKFINEFPNAMDVIVRGIKSGLPLGDCLRIIASEASEPVRTEFRLIVESQTMGLSNAEAVERIVDRVPVTEANFFSIVISIQQKSGGNLSEALGNLSRVLRERKKMRGKVSAMSTEAKASAAIIGSLPFIVTAMVYISSPRYIELLWLTTTGKLTVGVSLFWMFLGIMMMKKMITFDV